MARFYWYLIGAFLLVSVSGQPSTETGNCPENEICDTETKLTCKETDENGNCRDTACTDIDPTTGECRQVASVNEEKMQKMQESPRSMKKMRRAKKGLHIALILKKKKQMMNAFHKPKPKPPPPHHHHHHHESDEEEEEEEEEEIPEAEDAPEIRLFNDEICLDGDGNCNTTITVTPPVKPRKPVTQPDPAEANVRKRVIRFLKVLRQRRRLSPFLGRMRRRNAPKVSPVSPQEKMRK